MQCVVAKTNLRSKCLLHAMKRTCLSFLHFALWCTLGSSARLATTTRLLDLEHHHAPHTHFHSTFNNTPSQSYRTWLPNRWPLRHLPSPTTTLVSSKPFRESCATRYTIHSTTRSTKSSTTILEAFAAKHTPSAQSLALSAASLNSNTTNGLPWTSNPNNSLSLSHCPTFAGVNTRWSCYHAELQRRLLT